MFIKSEFKPEIVACKDPTRPAALCHAHLDTSGTYPRVVATDGHCLVSLPVALDEGDVEGPLPAAALIDARKVAKKNKAALAAVECNGVVNVKGVGAFERPDLDGSKFPDWRQILATNVNKCVTRVAIDIALLRKVADAMGCGGIVTLEIFDDMSPVTVRAGNAQTPGDEDPIAVVMPIRIGAI